MGFGVFCSLLKILTVSEMTFSFFLQCICFHREQTLAAGVGICLYSYVIVNHAALVVTLLSECRICRLSDRVFLLSVFAFLWRFSLLLCFRKADDCCLFLLNQLFCNVKY